MVGTRKKDPVDSVAHFAHEHSTPRAVETKVRAVRSATIGRKSASCHPRVAGNGGVGHPPAGYRRASRGGALTVIAWTLVAVPAFLAAPVLHAQDPARRWSASSELSFVRTGGNAESSTFGIGSTVTRSWERTEVKVEAGGIRTRSTRVRRVAVGSESDFRLDETSESDISAENYKALARVDRQFSSRTALFVQTGWTRNTFAGFKYRLVNVLGVSTRWARNEKHRLRTAYGLTHTVQRDEVTDPDAAGRFLGLRLSSEYWRRITGNTEWRSNLVMDGNGDDTSDVRADWTNSISVAMNAHLGLKTSLRTTFDNQPSLAKVPLWSSGGERVGSVLVPRDELDRVFTIALVVTF